MNRIYLTIIGIFFCTLIAQPFSVFAASYPAPTQVHIYQKTNTSDVIISWRYVTAPTLIGFHVYRSEKITDSGKIIQTTNKGARVFVDTSALPNITYFYTVRAVYTPNSESLSSQQVSITPLPPTPAMSSALTFFAPASMSIPALDTSPNETQSTIKIGDIEIVDKRKNNPSAGWTLSIAISNLTTLDGGVIPITNLKMTLEGISIVSGTNSGIAFPKEVIFQDANKDGISDSVVILSAAPGFGKGDFKINPTFTLKVPAFTTAGNYTTKMTFTLR